MRLRRMAPAGTLLAAIGLGGCYSYFPARVEDIQPLERVKVTVTDAQARELSEVLRGETRTFVGVAQPEATSAELLFRVPLRNDAAGTSSRPLSGNVVVQRDAVLQVERRRLSVWKTSLLGAFGAALAGYVLYDAFTDERPKPGEGGKPGPDEAPITLFRWGIAVGR